MKTELTSKHRRGSYVVFVGLNFSGKYDYHICFYRATFMRRHDGTSDGTNRSRSYNLQDITKSSLRRILRVLSTTKLESIFPDKFGVDFYQY